MNPENVLESGIQQRVALTAPFDGIITLVQVNLGKQVGPEEVLYQLYNPKHMHVELQVYPKDLEAIAVGLPIQYKVQGTSSWKPGRVVLVGGAVNAETRTVRVHAHADVDDPSLKPGAYIQAKIAVAIDTLVAIPTTGIVKEDGKSYVFVAREDGFERVGVKEVRRTATHVALEAYPSGMLVTHGAYYLVEVEEEDHDH